jgi:hypothetical protein
VFVTIIFLKKSDISGIFPFASEVTPWVGEEEVALTTLSDPESFLTSSSIGGLTGRDLFAVSSAIERGAVMAQQVVMQQQKMGRQEREMTG